MNIIKPILPDFFPEEEKAGITPEMFDSMIRFASETSLRENLIFSLEKAEIDGMVVLNYESLVTARFTAENGDIFIRMEDGYLNVTELVTNLKKMM